MRTPGFGRVYRRRDIWWLEYWHRNQQIRISSGSQSRTVALKMLRDKLEDLGRGVSATARTERFDFDELVAILVEDYTNNARKSAPRLRTALKHLREHFGRDRAVDITSRRLSAFVTARRAEKASSASIKMELALLKRAFNLSMRAGYMSAKPMFPSIEVRNTRSGFFEEHEFQAVHANLPSWVKPVAEFMYLTGWRTGEVLRLRWHQVDLRAGTVRLEPGTTKNDEGRMFPAREGTALHALLLRQRLATSDLEQSTGRIVPHVFHRDGKQVASFRKSWIRACAAAGLPGRIPHDFRRTAVRNLERAGVARSVAMKLTGHKTESVYRRYAIVCESDLAEGVARLEKLRQDELAGRGGMVAFQRGPQVGGAAAEQPAGRKSRG